MNRLIITLIIVFLFPAFLQAENIPQSTVIGTLPKALKEVSGIIASRTQPGVFWAHNDAGNKPIIYGFSFSSDRLIEVAKVTLEIEKKFDSDWEDITIGEGPGGSDWLYISDTGNNDFDRVGATKKPSRILRIKEPIVNALLSNKVSKKKKGGSKKSETKAVSLKISANSIQVANLDLKAQYDIESLAFNPLDKNIYLVSKELNGVVKARVFRLSPASFVWTKLSSTSRRSVAPNLVGDLNINGNDGVTSASFNKDGKTLALLFQNYIRLYHLPNGDIGSLATANPSLIPISQTQPEGISFVLQDYILTTSEESREVTLFSF